MKPLFSKKKICVIGSKNFPQQLRFYAKIAVLTCYCLVFHYPWIKVAMTLSMFYIKKWRNMISRIYLFRLIFPLFHYLPYLSTKHAYSLYGHSFLYKQPQLGQINCSAGKSYEKRIGLEIIREFFCLKQVKDKEKTYKIMWAKSGPLNDYVIVFEQLKNQESRNLLYSQKLEKSF